MCSISGSFDKDTLIKLLKLNESRGSFSHSLTVVDPIDRTVSTVRQWGLFDVSLLDSVKDGQYMVTHCQAPTNGLVKDEARIHPYEIPGVGRLLHNGIITPKSLKIMNESMNTHYEWDTQALLEYLNDSHDPWYIKGYIDWNRADTIEGSFACVYINEDANVYVVRNQIAPLFIDANLSISSTKFENSTPIPANVENYLNFDLMEVGEIRKFNNTYNPFFFG